MPKSSIKKQFFLLKLFNAHSRDVEKEKISTLKKNNLQKLANIDI